jgi:hypothetical protein
MKIIRSLFLSLTNQTYPHGSEKSLNKMLMSEYGFKDDGHKNLYLVIKTEKGNLPSTMFTAHTDTVVDSKFYRFCKKYKLPFMRSKPINHVFSRTKDFVKAENSTLGADDKAGLAIILFMIIHQKPGIYYLFNGEEFGRLGSKNLRSYFYKNKDLRNVTKCISLDRHGYTSVITHQRYGRCCSDEFAIDVCKNLNKFGFWFSPDPTGMGTDSLSFDDRISECTNISVGYFKEHTIRECQDLYFLDILSIAFVNIDWEIIKARRDALTKRGIEVGFNDFSFAKYQNLLYPKPVIKQ